MYVCLCRVVTRVQIEAVVAAGARTVEEVGEACAAGTECGKCRRTIMRILESHERDTASSPAERRPR